MIFDGAKQPGEGARGRKTALTSGRLVQEPLRLLSVAVSHELHTNLSAFNGFVFISIGFAGSRHAQPAHIARDECERVCDVVIETLCGVHHRAGHPLKPNSSHYTKMEPLTHIKLIRPLENATQYKRGHKRTSHPPSERVAEHVSGKI